MKKALTFLTAILFLAGCVSTGAAFDSSKVGLIKKNITKRSQIHEWFGYPYMTGIDNGDETWIYNFSKTSIAGKTLMKNLYIVFGESGMVKSFTFSTSFPEEIAPRKETSTR